MASDFAFCKGGSDAESRKRIRNIVHVYLYAMQPGAGVNQQAVSGNVLLQSRPHLNQHIHYGFVALAVREVYGINDDFGTCDDAGNQRKGDAGPVTGDGGFETAVFLAIWGDASDNIPGVPGIGEKGACKLVAQWGTAENILQNAAEIKGKQGEKIAAWGDRLLLAKRLTTICTDVPVAFEPSELEICQPNVDELKALFAELDFTAFARDIYNMAPAEEPSDAPRQAPQRQLAEMARAKSAAARREALAGQGNLFEAPAEETPAAPQAATDAPDTTEEDDTAAATDPVFATAATTPHDYRLVTEIGELRQIVERLRTEPEICFDTETTGLDIFNDRIVGLSLAVREHEAWYISFTPQNTHDFAEAVRPLFENPDSVKIGQNIKFDIMVLAHLGIEVRGRKIDTMILHYLLDSEARHNMNYLAQRYLNYSPIAIETLIGRGARQLTMDQVNIESVKEYAAEDADITLQLKRVLWEEVCRQSLDRLYLTIEEPMIDVLAEMEMTGVKIDSALLADYAVELNALLAQLEGEIRREVGEPTLNVNSARQIGEVLFAKMRIAEKPRMTRTHQFSTEEEYLQGFARKHRIVDLILQYRGVKKLLSTYVEALPQLVNRATGRIHTSFNQAVTSTGRLSSTNPNLQNIPVRDELGRRIREAFIPSDGEHLLLSADYSQVELRLMAHLSGDRAMIEAFGHGEDIHTATAALLFHAAKEDVTREQRRRAKTANFGIIYGISAFGLAQRLNIPCTEAKEIIDGYFQSYPDIRQYMERVIDQARENGYVETLFGRKRMLPDIRSGNAVVRGLSERNAINAPIQGGAADIMKLAMVRVHDRLKREGLRARLLMQVHDELIAECPAEEQAQVKRILTEEMEHAAALSVPLTVDAHCGKNWLEAKG